ncbi:arginase [Halobaculum sp. P14]|uniref:arginase n=1 Tax=Halobaculum sp. P14 TaxID=3421638 RepID=UPI003EBE57A1
MTDSSDAAATTDGGRDEGGRHDGDDGRDGDDGHDGGGGRVRVIGAPTDYGQDRRGVDMGPSAIRYGGLSSALEDAGIDCVDAGDLPVPRAEERDPDYRMPAEGNAKFLREIEAVTDRLADEVADAIAAGDRPLVLGGDHSIAIGSLRGSARDADVGAVWFDAHGDYNTPTTSPSGNVHGMPLAAALGYAEWAGVDWANADGLREENVVYVGLRSLDSAERDAIRDSEMTAYTMSDIDESGITDVVEAALSVAADGVDGVHVSLDLDWLDPSIAPGVGTAVRGGVTYREAHYAMERVADADVLRSMELVEVNPVLDQHNETAELATELAASAFGKRIL